MTPGERGAGYRGIQIGGDLLDTLAITDGYTRRKDDIILSRSAICEEIGISAEMNCTNYPRLTTTPGECDASYGGTQIGGDLHGTLAIPDDYTKRKDDVSLARFAVCVEIDSSADMNCTAVELNNVTLRRKSPQDVSTEQDMNCVSVSTSRIKEDSTAPEPYDHLCRRRSLPLNRVVAEVGGSVYRHRKHGPRATDHGSRIQMDHIGSLSADQSRRR